MELQDSTKMKFLISLLLSVLAVFAPAKGMLITALVLILADLVTGVIAAKKRGEKITSAGFRRTVVKFFVYESAIMLGFLTQTFLTGSYVPVSNLVAGLIGLTEMKSCLENLNEVNGGSIFTTLIEKLGSQSGK